MPAKPTFGTVLIKRRANERPKEWELRLRPICSRLRVVEKLLGEPHLLVTGSPTVAVRIYDADDTSRLEDAATNDEDSSDGADEIDVDGLRTFRDKYEHSIVIFILPTGQHQRDQLGRRDSFVSTAQKSLLWRDEKGESENGKKKHTSRTAIVTDISQVIQTIDSTVQSLAPEKRDKRRKYFAHVASQHFYPSQKPTQEAIANHVTKTFNAWAERFEMPDGDSSVALSMMGSLASVATANASSLDDVPIRNASKELISQFFGSNNADDETPVEEDKMEAPQSNEDEFFDDIDDSEFLELECPDPSIQNTSQQENHQTPFEMRNFQTSTTNQNHQSLGDNVDFTPMVPPRALFRQEPEYNATPSIFPESFNRQGHFSHPPSTGGYQQSTSNGYGYPSNYPNQMYAGNSAPGGTNQQHLSPPPESRGGNYRFQHGSGGMQDTNQGYGGYYSQSAGYHPHQQFM